jgi:hypothetical protein
MKSPLPLRSKSDLDEIVDLLKEARTIPLFKRSGPTCPIPHIPEIGREFPIRERTADGVFRENSTPRVQYSGTFLKATGREQNVSRHGDVVFFHMLHDPIICRVSNFLDNYLLKQSVRLNSHPGVGNYVDFETVPEGHSKNFALHRAPVRVNENSDQ